MPDYAILGKPNLHFKRLGGRRPCNNSFFSTIGAVCGPPAQVVLVYMVVTQIFDMDFLLEGFVLRTPYAFDPNKGFSFLLLWYQFFILSIRRIFHVYRTRVIFLLISEQFKLS